jgi:Protein of unknown function (DUF3551)
MSAMMSFRTVTMATAATAAALTFGVSPGRAAAGGEPWCIIDDQGNAHCNYATSQDCLQESALSRGFCTPNSSASTPGKRSAQ